MKYKNELDKIIKKLHKKGVYDVFYYSQAEVDGIMALLERSGIKTKLAKGILYYIKGEEL